MQRAFLSLPFSLAFGIAVHAQQLRIVYSWPNQPCSEILNCNTGCSACNAPDASGATFFGTNVGWIGVTTCPVPVALGDNSVFTTGWQAVPSNDHTVIISGITLQPVRIDSVVLRHARYTDGPMRLKALFTGNAAAALEEAGDVETTSQFTETALVDVGEVIPGEGSSIGTFQLRFQPYEAVGGGWSLDEVRIVATPIQASTTGVPEVWMRPQGRNAVWYDVMGRPVGQDPAPGMYIGNAGRRVQVF
jgi:hypothetical protein